jgi:hypothetical protein
VFESQIPDILLRTNIGHWRLAYVALVFVCFLGYVFIETKQFGGENAVNIAAELGC